jgi:hypothetical protein
MTLIVREESRRQRNLPVLRSLFADGRKPPNPVLAHGRTASPSAGEAQPRWAAIVAPVKCKMSYENHLSATNQGGCRCHLN